MSGTDPAGRGGLTDEAARLRLARDGPNELPGQPRRSLVQLIIDVVREPMLLLLMAGGAIYLMLGDLAEAVMLLVFACTSVVLTIVQQTRSERAIVALRSLASPRALVIRDRMRQRIAASELVIDDLVVLTEGDRVPADGWVIENDGLSLDESLLTGESLPVEKGCGPAQNGAPPRPGGGRVPFAFAGTLVVGGGGLIQVAATGARSEIGRIGASLVLLETGSPRLRRETRRIVALFAIAAGVAIVLATLLYGWSRGTWLEATLAGIAIGMSLLPEEFGVVLTIFLAMGALRMSRERVLARRASAIEALGTATVLCTDKTGTLTENRMRVATLRLADGKSEEILVGKLLPARFAELVRIARLASAPEPVDPMEIAFHAVGDVAGSGNDDETLTLQRHYPLHSKLLAVSRVWCLGPVRDECLVACKGAPEIVADLCGMDAASRIALEAEVIAMAKLGRRVLGVAQATWREGELPESQRSFDFRFMGLIGLEDPLRSSVPAAVRECRSAGIRVVLITGDYPETARAIAGQAGIEPGEIVTGTMLESWSESDLRRRCGGVTIFARTLPEQKLRIVRALQAMGAVVAMTGDGVNDAPALKAADIGVAMGARGSDVAREAASIVLLDDDFGSIVRAVRMGRRIYDNLSKAMAFIVAVHVPIAGLAIAPLIFGWPILLGPVHIALLELIIDPVSSLAFEAEKEEADIMSRPPRGPQTTLLGLGLIGPSLLQGTVALAMVGTLWLALRAWAVAADVLRSAVFVGLVAAVISLVLVNRSFSASLRAALRKPNLALGGVIMLVAALLVLAELVPVVGELLGFAAITARESVAALAVGVAVLIMLQVLKALMQIRLA